MSDEDYGAEFALAHGSKVVDGKVKHEDTAVVWFYSEDEARAAINQYVTADPVGLVVVRRAWAVVG